MGLEEVEGIIVVRHPERNESPQGVTKSRRSF